MQRLFLLVPLVLLLAACSSSSEKAERREAYIDADYYTRLELPPDLTEPDFNKALIVPEPGASAKQRFERQTRNLKAEDGASATPQPAATAALVLAGAALQQDSNGYWLELEQSVEQIWSVLSEFLQNEGLPVRRQEAQIGLMETDWVSKYQVAEDAGFLKRAFTSFEPDRVDRFTLRIERSADNAASSRVYITHAGMELTVEAEDANYLSREREPALEAEMLQRLALFVGAAGARVQDDLYRPFAERVRDSEFEANSIEIVGTQAHVEQRLRQALQAMNITRVEQGEQSGELMIRFDEKSAQIGTQDKDDLSETSFIMKWFKDNDDVKAAGLMLKLTGLKQHTRLDINNPDGEPDKSTLAEQFSQRLKQQLL
jgi:outer membrane protein assembly factor BamC